MYIESQNLGRMILTLGQTVWDKCGRNVTTVETSGNRINCDAYWLQVQKRLSPPTHHQARYSTIFFVGETYQICIYCDQINHL